MTLNEEILAGRNDRSAKRLLENIDFSDNYYNIRYSETGDMLAEFDYNTALTEVAHNRTLAPKKIMSLRESIENALNNIEGKKELEKSYAILADAYMTLKN